MADLQHDLDVDKAAAFSILMAHGKGISSKSPDYMMEKWRGIQECRNQMEVVSFLDVFGQHIFFKWRDLWFKEDHGDSWPYCAGPLEGAGSHKPSNVGSTPSPATIPTESSSFPTTNEGEEQKPAPTLRFIKCGEHLPYLYCYLQDDGAHLQKDSCVCGSFPKEECPLDLHRWQAVRGFTGDSVIHA